MSWYPVVRRNLRIFEIPRTRRGLREHPLLDGGDGPNVLESVFHVSDLVMGPLIHSFFHGDDCSCATQVVFVLYSYDTFLFLCDFFPGNSSRVVTFESSTTPQPFHNVSSTKKPSLSGSTTSAEFNFRAKSSEKARAYS